MLIFILIPFVGATLLGAAHDVGGEGATQAPWVRVDPDGPVAPNFASPPRHIRFGLDFDVAFVTGARWLRLGFDGGADDVIRLDALEKAPARVWHDSLGAVPEPRHIYLSVDDALATEPISATPPPPRWVRPSLDE